MALPALKANDWLADSGAASHMVKDQDLFQTYIKTLNGTVNRLCSLPCLGKGSIIIKFNCGDQSMTVTLKDVLHVPKLPYQLISISRLTSADPRYKAIFMKDKVYFKHAEKTFAMGTLTRQLYNMDVTPVPTIPKAEIALFGTEKHHTWDDWHRIMGHINFKSLNKGATKQVRRNGSEQS